MFYEHQVQLGRDTCDTCDNCVHLGVEQKGKIKCECESRGPEFIKQIHRVAC